MTGTLSQYEALAKALDAFHAADAGRDRAICILTAAAFAADPGSLVAPSTVAWAEQRVKTFKASLTAIGDKRRWDAGGLG
jgi:hypothetical protein